MADSKPLVVLLCLTEYESFRSRNSHLLVALGERSEVHIAKTRPEALRYLTSTALPQAVIACDPSVAYPEYHDVLLPLVRYAHGGGTVVYAGVFATFVGCPDMKSMFKVGWDLPWEMALGCDDRVFALNFAAKGLDLKPLAKKYDVKAIQVENGIPDQAVYLGQNQLKRLAKDKDKALANVPLSAPIVFCNAGQGRVGYIGDFGSTEPTELTTAIVLAMCFHPASKALVAPGTISPVSVRIYPYQHSQNGRSSPCC